MLNRHTGKTHKDKKEKATLLNVAKVYNQEGLEITDMLTLQTYTELRKLAPIKKVNIIDAETLMYQ